MTSCCRHLQPQGTPATQVVQCRPAQDEGAAAPLTTENGLRALAAAPDPHRGRELTSDQRRDIAPVDVGGDSAAGLGSHREPADGRRGGHP